MLMTKYEIDQMNRKGNVPTSMQQRQSIFGFSYSYEGEYNHQVCVNIGGFLNYISQYI